MYTGHAGFTADVTYHIEARNETITSRRSELTCIARASRGQGLMYAFFRQPESLQVHSMSLAEIYGSPRF